VCHGICPQSVGQARHSEACASGGAEGANGTLGHAIGGRGIGGGNHIGRQPQIQQALLKLGRVELSPTISVYAVASEASVDNEVRCEPISVK
jgi:hypothetical protein